MTYARDVNAIAVISHIEPIALNAMEPESVQHVEGTKVYLTITVLFVIIPGHIRRVISKQSSIKRVATIQTFPIL